MKSRNPLSWSRATVVAVALVVLIAGLQLARFRGIMVDDVYISLRYAHNLADGHGPVFNLGERVEGYTNPTLVAVAALIIRLGLDPLTWLQLFLLMAAAATLWGVARLEKLGPDRKPGPSLAALVLAPLTAFAFWASCPMESLFFTALATWSVLVIIGRLSNPQWLAPGLLLTGLALTRPDGVIFIAVAVIATGAVGLSQQPRPSLAPLIKTTSVAAAFSMAHLLWRHSYYGAWVPNTFTAKTTWGWAQIATGLGGLRDFTLAMPLLVLALAAPLVIWRRQRQLPPAVVVVGAVALTWVSYVTTVGGDFMPWFRFFVPVLPLLAVLLAWGIEAAIPLTDSKKAAVVIFLAVLHLSLGMLTNERHRALVAHRTTVVGEAVGKWFDENLEPAATMAVNTAGAVPYFSKRQTLDMLGLTDREIAERPVFVISTGWASHRRGWGQRVLETRPDAVLFYNSSGAREPHYLSDHELAESPIFRFFYAFRSTTLPALSPEGSPAEPFARVLGWPFTRGDGSKGTIDDLGLAATSHGRLLRSTEFTEVPIVLRYFRFDHRDDHLWPLGAPASDNIDDVLDQATQHWQRQRRPAAPATSAAEVERLCDRARQAVAAKNIPLAQELLSAALFANREVHSPLPPHYAANVASMSGDLWAAIAAQKEALRLAPGTALYRSNLRALLHTPLKEFKQLSSASGQPK